MVRETARINIPVRIPLRLYRLLRVIKHRLLRLLRKEKCRSPCNLEGDREVEWSWVASQMPAGPGRALDFGIGQSYLGLMAAQRGFEVTAVDLEDVLWPYAHPDLHFIQGDIMELQLPEEHFDLVINCSAIEHVGLAGRYGVEESVPDGDLEAMARMRELMKTGGVMILTIPVGEEGVVGSRHRIYGSRRLKRLLEGYTVEKEICWVKDADNRWKMCDREEALDFGSEIEPLEHEQSIYALGCFVLERVNTDV